MLTFELSKQYKGFGISNGLDRGLLVYQNGSLLLDEGMGLGAISVQSEGLNYFASILQINTSPTHTEATLSIDKMLLRTIYGIPSKRLTRFIEKTCTKMYKKQLKTQGFWFKLGNLINLLLQIKVDFIKVPSKGLFVLNYQIQPEEILIDLSGRLECPVDQIFIMNEMSGNLFCHSIESGDKAPPPSGWQPTTEGSQLYSDSLHLSFETKEISKPEMLTSQLFWGRELAIAHCWAGFIYQLRTETLEFKDFKYAVLFREGD